MVEVQNGRRVYCGETDDGNGVPCPDCGCRHRINVSHKIGDKTMTISTCRYCGRQTVSTSAV